MKLNDLILRCFAERDNDGSWFVMCLDLNLYARGDSFEEARAKLHGFIKDYFTDAVSKDVSYFHDLVPRKAPLYFFVRYYLIAIQCLWRDFCRMIAHKSRVAAEEIHRCLFKESLPVRPC